MNNPKQTDIKSLDDPRLQFLPKEERKNITRELKAQTRKSTQVVFRGKYATQSKSRKSLIIHIKKEDVSEDGLHLTISDEDISTYLEDGITQIPIYEVERSYGNEAKTNNESKDPKEPSAN